MSTGSSDRHINNSEEDLISTLLRQPTGYTALSGIHKLQLEVYADAAWADDLDAPRSTCGYVFFFGKGPVVWKSGRYSLVAPSTTDASLHRATLSFH